MGSIVVYEKERDFEKVAWGRTMNIFGPEICDAKHLKINITEYAPNTAHELHRHPDQEEVIFILDGEGITRTDAGDQKISTGAFVFVPAGTDHATLNVLSDKPMKAVIIKGPPWRHPGNDFTHRSE